MIRRTLSLLRFDEIRVAAIVFGLMLLPVSGILFFLELFVPASEVRRLLLATYELSAEPQLKLYVLYLTAAVAHVIVSTLVIAFLNKGLQKDISGKKRQALQTGAYVLSSVIVVLFVFIDSLSPVLALLSHQRIYAVLEKSPLFASYFISPISPFYLFSLLPAGLVILGLVVIAMTCLSLGRDLTFVSHCIRSRPTAENRRDIDVKIRSFHNYFYVLSAVLATSTIATTLFLKLPLTSIADGGGYAAFDELSNAMSICWGVTFSLTMLAMCFYPYFRVQQDLRRLVNDARVTDDIELQRWVSDIQENYVIYTNLKSLVSIFMPAVLGALSTFV